VHTCGRVLAFTFSLGLPLLKMIGAMNRVIDQLSQSREIYLLFELWKTLLALSLDLVPFDPRTLVSEVQQQPKLEARIRKSERYSVSGSLLFRIVKVGMFVNIEHAPDLVV
jgi:hypothetical protein